MFTYFSHEDGSIKFWQASSENLEIMYKLKTGRHFERIVPLSSNTNATASENLLTTSSSPPNTTTNNNTTSLTSGPDSTSSSINCPSSNANRTTASYNLLKISHAVVNVELCVDSRLLLVAGASGQVTLFRFVKSESCQEIAVCCIFLFKKNRFFFRL